MSRRIASGPKTLTIAEARASLADVVRRAERGEEVQITRRGIPVATVRSIRSEDNARAERFRALVARVASVPLSDDAESDPWADVRDLRPGRPPPTFER